MSARSWLFVPGDSERKQERAAGCAADALILDLEDSVAPARLPQARALVLAFLRKHRARAAPRLWVRMNGLASGELLADLVVVLAGAPEGIVLPKVSTAAEILEVDHYLTALECALGLARGSTKLLPIATETPQALLRIGEFAAPLPRLIGLTWGAEDLSAALGASAEREPGGRLGFAFELARSLCLITAAAAGVQAVDGICAEYSDRDALARELARARREGFSGKLAIHPDQIEPINAAFTPTAAEIAGAQRIVAAFAAAPEAGVTSLDGRMIDRPHLIQARRVLETAERLARG
ncbi:MAG TPA: CoA ester lyase [Steroidobacteraceae bacterium]|nr:CoA ester lyase [Steroidobacteraceae bacterium]